jgi:hypothetical protein
MIMSLVIQPAHVAQAAFRYNCAAEIEKPTDVQQNIQIKPMASPYTT